VAAYHVVWECVVEQWLGVRCTTSYDIPSSASALTDRGSVVGIATRYGSVGLSNR